jgi:hypothetical protein
MLTEMRNDLREIVRGVLGQCDMRFYDDSVTVTLIRDFNYYTVDELYGILYEMANEEEEGSLYEHMLRNADIVNANRFKLLIPKNWDIGSNKPSEDFDAPNVAEDAAAQARLLGTDVDDLRKLIGDTVSEAHEGQQLENLLVKDVQRGTEEFIATNLSAAMVILKKSKMHISLDETKDLMRLCYLAGLWDSARERDLPILVKAFNDLFGKYAEEWSLAEMQGGQA